MLPETSLSSPLLERWPEVAAAVQNVRIEAEIASRGQTQTLRINGIHLTSSYDREAEAELIADQVPMGVEEIWVFGVALGDLPTTLLHRTSLKRLVVVILQPGLVRAALQSGLLITSWLSDPRVDCRLGRNVSTPPPNVPFVVAPACLPFAETPAAALRDQLLLALAKPFQDRRHAEREPMLAACIQANEARVAIDADVASWFATALGGRSVVAAGGPTLGHRLDWLAEQRSHVFLTAVSTAMLPLERGSIVPDAVVVIDPKPELLEHYEGLDLDRYRNVPLVYLPCVQPEVLDRWPGPRLSAFADHPRYDDLRSRFPRGDLFCSGTVTHAAVDLVVKRGADEVTLLGADFGYIEGRSHAPGAAQERGLPETQGVWVLDGQGEPIPSDVSLVGFLRDLESYIAAHPNVRFLRGSLRGAAITGTSCLP